VSSKKPQIWLGPAIGYTDLLDAALDDEAKKEAAGPRTYNPLRPSSAGKCARKLAYELAEYRLGWKYEIKPLEARTKRIFALGHSVEYNAIRDFRKLPGFKVKYLQQVVDSFSIERGKPEFPLERLEGSLDWVLWSDEHRVVMDAKSRREKFFSKWASDWKSEISRLTGLDSTVRISAQAVWVDNLRDFIAEVGLGETIVDNVIQLNIYACSPFCTSRGIDHASIYRVNKNTSAHYEVRFRPSPEVVEMTRQKFNVISRAVDIEQPELAPQEHEVGSFTCGFCDFAKFCRPGVDARQAFFNKSRRGD
jgi:hypothetical protein